MGWFLDCQGTGDGFLQRRQAHGQTSQVLCNGLPLRVTGRDLPRIDILMRPWASSYCIVKNSTELSVLVFFALTCITRCHSRWEKSRIRIGIISVKLALQNQNQNQFYFRVDGKSSQVYSKNKRLTNRFDCNTRASATRLVGSSFIKVNKDS